MDDQPEEQQSSIIEEKASIFSGAEKSADPLVYEETPIIEPIQEEVMVTPPPLEQSQEPEPPSPQSPENYPVAPQQRASSFGWLGDVFVFAVLFGVGILLSMILREFIPNGISPIKPPVEVSPTPTPVAEEAPLDPYAEWIRYDVVGSLTRQPVGNIKYKLPGSVQAPTCDPPSCASTGTNLPGLTRFTVSARETRIPDNFLETKITDATGHQFITKETTIAQRPALEFTGMFSGSTTGGFAFKRMRGVMIAVTDNLLVEFNHFSPSALPNADFDQDDTIFEKMLGSVEILSAQSSTSLLTPAQ